MLKKMLIEMYCRARFGRVKEVVKESIDGIAAEVAFYNSKGKLIGYWAYGYYDPRLPFQEWCEGCVQYERGDIK